MTLTVVSRPDGDYVVVSSSRRSHLSPDQARRLADELQEHANEVERGDGR